jgi:hypothetical protein
MNALLALALLCAVGIALFGLTKWLEHAMRRPGLADLIFGSVFLACVVLALATGRRLTALFLAVFAMRSFYHWRRAAGTRTVSDAG